MKSKSKSKKSKPLKAKARIKTDEIDPDQFTVFELKPDWEKQMSDVWSPEDIKQFKERQELLSKIPIEVRDRTKADKSYREGWIDSAAWILDNIIRAKDEVDKDDKIR